MWDCHSGTGNRHCFVTHRGTRAPYAAPTSLDHGRINRMTYVRMTTLQCDPSKLEEGIRFAREQSPAILRAQPGFEGMRLLVDRASGKMVAVVQWESEATAQASDRPVSES